MTEVLVVGGGPAGRALAVECAARGLDVTLVDPAPHAPWRATYAAWLDELPAGLPPPAAKARGRVIACTTHILDRTYAVLDVPALRAHLDARLAAAGVRVLTGRVAGHIGRAADPSVRAREGLRLVGRGEPGERRGVVLTDGTWLTADVIVDAGGHRAPLRDRAGPGGPASELSGLASGLRASLRDLACGLRASRSDRTEDRAEDRADDRAALDRPPSRRGAHYRDATAPTGHEEPTTARIGGRPGVGVAAEQTAYGLVVDAATAAPLVGPDEALFMDWRPDHGESGWPTFLYAVPLGGDAVLLEETSLARRPGLPLPVLRRRLHARLAHHGVTPPPAARVERVRFPVDRPRHTTPGVLGFGAAAPLVHPATGFSVADALRLAPAVAEALATGGVPAAQRLIWPARAVAVHRLRRIGLEALLRMPPEAVPDFFETFFALPERHRDTYLSRRDDLAGHLAAMGALFGHADTRLRSRLVVPAFRGPAPAR